MRFREHELILSVAYLARHGKTLVDLHAPDHAFPLSFAKRGWRVLAIEPDANRQGELRGSLLNYPDLVCVPDLAGKGSGEQPVDGGAGEAPSGPVSGELGAVGTTASDAGMWLGEALSLTRIETVTVLRVQMSGSGLAHLKTMDWRRYRPGVVVCDFRGVATEGRILHEHHDVAAYLKQQGYSAYVAEYARTAGDSGSDGAPVRQCLGFGRYPLDHPVQIASLLCVPQERLAEFVSALGCYLVDTRSREAKEEFDGGLQFCSSAFRESKVQEPGETHALARFGIGLFRLAVGIGLSHGLRLRRDRSYCPIGIPGRVKLSMPVKRCRSYVRALQWKSLERRIPRRGNGPDPVAWGEQREKFYDKYGCFVCPSGDIQRLRGLKDKYKGHRIFVIGNGPSLKRTPMDKLADEYTFATNRFYLMYDQLAWRPSFYTTVDWRVGPDNADEINALEGSTFFFPERFRNLLRDGDDVYWYWHDQSGDPRERTFSHDMTRGVRGAGSVTGTAIQIAYFLGFDPIYLIGVDASYKIQESVRQSGPDKFGHGVGLRLESTADDDESHFDPRYFGKGRRWHDPNVPGMIRGYIHCKEGILSQKRRIYNATVGGKLEVFERVDISDLLA